MDKVEQGKAAKKRTMADIMAKKRPVTKQVVVQLDGQLASEIANLRAAHTAARDNDRISNEPDKAPAIAEEIDRLVEQSRETEVIFTFTSIGRPNYDRLVELPEHKPTREQKKEGASFNSDTFPAALVAASAVDPEITLDEAKEMFDDPSWNGAELARIFMGALEANTETGDIPLSRDDSETSLSSLLSLVTQQSMESPTPAL